MNGNLKKNTPIVIRITLNNNTLFRCSRTREREKGEEIVVAYVYRSYELSTREPYYRF